MDVKKAENMKDKGLLKMHGELGTFIVHVQYHENQSWQGKITWMENKKTLNFRSTWEMLKLIGSAVETAADGEEELSWFEGEE